MTATYPPGVGYVEGRGPHGPLPDWMPDSHGRCYCGYPADKCDAYAEALRLYAPERVLHHFLTEHASSLKKFERAELAYQTVVDAHREAFGDTVTADYRASSHPDLKQAQGDAAYYRDRALMYGLSALIELMRGQR